MKKLLLLAISLSLLIGCAHIDPGANALVVRAEQTEVIALSTFDLLLNLDNSNREFYKTKAPEFHNFCEFLRQPINVHGINYPRAVAMVMTLQEVKAAYKISDRKNQSLLTAALNTLTATMDQAGIWLQSINKEVK